MKYILKSLILIAIFSMVACDKSLEEINIDPNNSPSANESQVLSSILGNMGYLVDTDLNSASFLWAQYYTWGIGVSIGNQERFVAQPDDYNNVWSRAYAVCLTDVKFLTKSDKASYKGVGMLLESYIYQSLVDHFGNVPYSEAVSGEISEGAILAPKYDDAATIYGSMISRVDEGMAVLENATSEIGSDDFVYGGNLSSWKKFGNSLKLRLLMRLSEVSPNGDAVKALIANGSFISSPSDVAKVGFSDISGAQNPMFARFEWGVGDFYFASNATVNVLNDLNDPRVNSFYSKATTGTFKDQIRGINQGTIDDEPFTAPASDYSGSSPYAYGPANSVVLMSDYEVWFLRAEAAARYGTADNDATAFANAISANFTNIGLAGAGDYTATLNYGGSLDEKLNKIGVQKWISLNGTQEDEGWIETRRFDRPGNRIFTGGIFQNPPLSVIPAGQFPSAWLYPASERSLNPNAPAQRSITDKIFWDN